MALPLVPGLTQTEADAEPLVYRLADVLERNPALMLADPAQIMDVVGKIAERRATVADELNSMLGSAGRMWEKEADPAAQHEIAEWITSMRGDEKDKDEAY